MPNVGQHLNRGTASRGLLAGGRPTLMARDATAQMSRYRARRIVFGFRLTVAPGVVGVASQESGGSSGTDDVRQRSSSRAAEQQA